VPNRRKGFGSAPGKVILFGEHAVVYGQPAVAVPLSDVRAQVTVTECSAGSGTVVEAPDLPSRDGAAVGFKSCLADLPEDDPLREMLLIAIRAYSGQGVGWPDFRVRVLSSIPLGRGLGSGAAVGTAVVRAVADFYDRCPETEEVSSLVFEIEKIFHGTPSGIDNTVTAYEAPLFFLRGKPPILLALPSTLRLVVGDAGPASPTREVVAFVRQQWEEASEWHNRVFDHIGQISRLASAALQAGDLHTVGTLMSENHVLLREMGVSTPALDRLVVAAESAGALGAKMSGAGWGGNMVALVDEESEADVVAQMRLSGAERIIVSEVGPRV
jgi:mevalonate kinase